MDSATTTPRPPRPRSWLRPRSPWHGHPGVRSGEQLTSGERAADRLRNGMGSWPFVGIFIAFMVAWALVNTLALGSDAWDPYPYILLNLFLSMLAGLQGAVLLIAAKRADQISAETALHTLRNTEQVMALLQRNGDLAERSAQLSVEVERLTRELHAHVTGPR